MQQISPRTARRQGHAAVNLCRRGAKSGMFWAFSMTEARKTRFSPSHHVEDEMDGRTNGFTWGAPKPVRPSCGCILLVERRTDTRPGTRLILSPALEKPEQAQNV